MLFRQLCIFTSALNENLAQRFVNAILLPSVRAWMRTHKALSPHLHFINCKVFIYFINYVHIYYGPIMSAKLESQQAI